MEDRGAGERMTEEELLQRLFEAAWVLRESLGFSERNLSLRIVPSEMIVTFQPHSYMTMENLDTGETFIVLVAKRTG